MTEINFRILNGTDRGKILRLPTPVSIGRDAGNVIQLNDVEVSRYHAEIRIENEEVVLADLNSKNGTRLNGLPIEQKSSLQTGDTIAVGSSEFIYGNSTDTVEDLASKEDRTVSRKSTLDRQPVKSFDSFDLKLEPYEWVPLIQELQEIAENNPEQLSRSLRDLPRAGTYYLVSLIGRGAMAKVFAAWEPRSNRPVAIKLFEPRHEEVWTLLQRFQNEAEAMNSLDKPGIVSLIDRANFRGRVYIVMNLVAGPTLSLLLDQWRYKHRQNTIADSQEPIEDSVWHSGSESSTTERVEASPSERFEDAGKSMALVSEPFPSAAPFTEEHFHLVAQIGRDVVQALKFSHEQGVLHRDIKPSNLLLDGHGKVWVVDFGLANVDYQGNVGDPAQTQFKDRLTRCGDLLGTVAYLSLGAVDGKYSEQSDLYSLGVTLYELAMLRPIWQGMSENEILRNLFEGNSPELIQKGAQGIPDDLAELINRLLQAETPGLQVNADQMHSCFDEYLRGQPIALPNKMAGVVDRSKRLLQRWFVKQELQTLALFWAILVIAFALILTYKRYGEYVVYKTKADNLHDSLQQQLNQSEYSVKMLAKFTESVDEVSVNGFFEFVSPIFEGNPEISSVAYARSATNASVNALIDSESKIRGEPFKVRSLNGQSPEQTLSRQVIITRYVPSSGNRDISGLDLLSDSRLSECLKQTNFTGKASAVGPVDLGEYALPQSGVAIIQRVNRTAELPSYAIVTTRFDDMLSQIRLGDDRREIFLRIIPGNLQKTGPIYEGDGNGRKFAMSDAKIDFQYELSTGSVNWKLLVGLSNPWSGARLSLGLSTAIFALLLPFLLIVVSKLMRALGRTRNHGRS